jgi:hypothetical protein
VPVAPSRMRMRSFIMFRISFLVICLRVLNVQSYNKKFELANFVLLILPTPLYSHLWLGLFLNPYQGAAHVAYLHCYHSRVAVGADSVGGGVGKQRLCLQ